MVRSMSELRSYLAESHLPRIRRREVREAAARARLAAEALALEGWRVRHLHTTFVPEDEVCLHVFEAASAEAVNEAMRRAALAADRIVEAVQ
jgi:Nickel responsive protein SCO4226-like